MSLINEMLKDLEQRRASVTKNNTEEKPLTSEAELTAPKEDKRKPIVSRGFMITLIILVILAVIIFFAMPSTKKTPKTEKLNIVAAQSRTKAKVKTPPPDSQKATKPTTKSNTTTPDASSSMKQSKKELIATVAAPDLPSKNFASTNQTTKLQSISLHQKQEDTKVMLIFDQKVQYQMRADDNLSKLSLILSNTKLASKLPNTHQQQTAIKAIQTDSNKKDLVLSLFLMPNTQIKKVTLSKDQPFTLSIVLENASLKKNSLPKETIKEVPLSPEVIVDQKYQQALALVSEDQLSSAIAELKNILAISPSYLPARKTLVTLFLKKKNLTEAEQYLEEGLRYTPDAISLIQLKARLLVQEGNLKKALEVLNQLSPSINDEPNYYALMATIQQRLGNSLMAAQLYDQLLTNQPNHSTWWLGLAISLESSNQINAAAQAYQKALDTGKLSPRLRAFVQSKLAETGNGS